MALNVIITALRVFVKYKYLYSIFLVPFTSLFIKMEKSEELYSLKGFLELVFNHDQNEPSDQCSKKTYRLFIFLNVVEMDYNLPTTKKSSNTSSLILITTVIHSLLKAGEK